MKRISIVTPCYNEEGNVRLLSARVKEVFAHLPGYDFEHIFADNCSQDGTLGVLKAMADEDPRIKIIVNAKNFGQIRSVFNAMLSAGGDAIVLLAADLQDPPELIPDFITKWEEGYQVVFGIRAEREETPMMVLARKLYYRVLRSVSEDELVSDAGDFFLFDKKVQSVLARVRDTNPYIRGLLVSLGFSHTGVSYSMAPRHSGKSTLNVFGLFVFGLNGFIHHSLLPMRVATLFGVGISLLSICAAFGYFILKLISWNTSPPGIATIIIGMFFLAGVQLFLLGFLGELIGAMFREGKNFPLVIERERVNFDARNDKENP